MAVASKRQAPPTHVTVWVGLAMATVGLLVALYSYTGSRVYDVAYAFVALVGGLVSLAGILVSAWGRAVMAARAGRARRLAMTQDTMKLQRELQIAAAEAAPTIAEPPSKKRFDFRATAKRFVPDRQRKETPVAEAAPSGRSIFAFRARKSAEASPPPPGDAAPALERVTLKCPQCSGQFGAEGVRPFTATCPQCGFSAEV